MVLREMKERGRRKDGVEEEERRSGREGGEMEKKDEV